MTQPQQHQPQSPGTISQDFVFTINRVFSDGEWLLAVVSPRKWSRSAARALTFSSSEEAEERISLVFSEHEWSDVYVGRICIGG